MSEYTFHSSEWNPGQAEPPFWSYRRAGKRALDLTLVLLFLPIVLLVILLLAAMVARDGGNPFYSQMRVGRGGRQFRFWKLRTMVADADAALARHLETNPQAAREWAETQKLRHDPRITATGHFLRASSLDELPQLFNVLTGDMTLVGPRPMMPSQRELYPGRDYFDLQPGLTGLWQVSARNESTFAARAMFDDTYNAEMSLALDLKILAQTVIVVLRRTGI